MLHWNRRIVVLTALVLGTSVLAAVGAGIHWAMATFLG
jgi:hypothetical protein